MSSDLERDYRRLMPLMKTAENQVTEAVTEALRKLRDPHLCRARMSESRIKSIASLLRKEEQRRLNNSDLIQSVDDLIGLRVVCNNGQDIKRAQSLIVSGLESLVPAGSIATVDYVASPLRSGYRALHVKFPLPISIGTTSAIFHVEIQIRSMLQDAWARLSREDMYGLERTHKDLSKQMRILADDLAKAEAVADELRNQLARRVSTADASSPVETMIVETYLLFAKEEPPRFLVDRVIAQIGSATVRSDALMRVLENTGHLKALREAFEVESSMQCEKMELFRFAVTSLLVGEVAGIQEATLLGREIRQEGEYYSRSEALASLPESDDDADDALLPEKDGDLSYSRVQQWAEAFGLLQECFCGEQYFDSYDLASEIANDLTEKAGDDRLDERMERILPLLGNLENADGCPIHRDSLDRDD